LKTKYPAYLVHFKLNFKRKLSARSKYLNIILKKMVVFILSKKWMKINLERENSSEDIN